MTKSSRLACWLPLFCALFTASSAGAEAPNITLRGTNGGAIVSGKLMEFDGTKYVLETSLGQMVVEASQVTCDGIDCPGNTHAADKQHLTVSIGDDLTPGLVPHLIEGFAAARNDTLVRVLDDDGDIALRLIGERPEAKIKTRMQRPGFAFSAITERKADLALTLQPPPADVVAVARANMAALLNNPDHQQIIALDAATVVVAATNPVRVLSERQIADIFAGRIANWAALGGPNAPIHPVVADAVLNLPQNPVADVLQSGKISATARLMPNAQTVSDQVASDPYAIGLTTYSNLRGATPVAVRGPCGIVTAPNRYAVLTGAYPFIQRIVAYRALNSETLLQQELTHYLASETAQDSVSDAGFVGQRIASISLDGQGQRFVTAMLNDTDASTSALLREFLGQIEQADRLSPTFRFRAGKRLARYINSRDLSNRELVFVGFTDSLGKQSKNRELSEARAELVKNQVMAMLTPEKRAATQAVSFGYGEIAPIACDDAARGQAANRRVEIWLRPRKLASQ